MPYPTLAATYNYNSIALKIDVLLRDSTAFDGAAEPLISTGNDFTRMCNREANGRGGKTQSKRAYRYGRDSLWIARGCILQSGAPVISWIKRNNKKKGNTLLSCWKKRISFFFPRICAHILLEEAVDGGVDCDLKQRWTHCCVRVTGLLSTSPPWHVWIC